MRNQPIYFFALIVICAGFAVFGIAFFDERKNSNDESHVQRIKAPSSESSRSSSSEPEESINSISSINLEGDWMALGDIKARFTNRPHLHYIEYMDKNATTANFDEFLDLIISDFGKGNIRNKLCESLFASVVSNSGAEAISFALMKIGDLPEGIEKSEIKTAILTGTSRIDFKDLQVYFGDHHGLIEDLVASEQHARHLGKILTMALLRDDHEITVEFLDTRVSFVKTHLNNPSIRKAAILQLAANSAAADPFHAWNLVATEGDCFTGTGYAGAAKRLISLMRLAEPQKTFDALGQSSYVPTDLVAEEFGSWVADDLRGSSAWFESKKGQWESGKLDPFRHGLIEAASSQGSFKKAHEWSDQVEDVSLRQRIKDDLWRKEMEAVTRRTRNEPAKILGELTSGESEFGEYWIKESFKTWFSSEPGDANTWYEKNEQALRPSQNQHVARAYAEVALGEGDINLARQWAEQVIDPNFKQKLVEQIDAAAGQTE